LQSVVTVRQCQAVQQCHTYLLTYLLPGGYLLSYPVGYPGNEFPDKGNLALVPRDICLINSFVVLVCLCRQFSCHLNRFVAAAAGIVLLSVRLRLCELLKSQILVN